MNADARGLKQVAEKIIGRAYKVANSLGAGFLENVYENPLRIELCKEGVQVEQQCPANVTYEGQMVGEYFADLVAENAVVVELKAVKALDEIHMAQCLNYLRATGFKVCLLINLGKPGIEIKRLVHGL